MATFQIYQDAEKENPKIPAHNEKKSAALGAAAGRTNLAVLNPNANVATRKIATAHKTAFREVSNVNKGQDENAGTAAVKKSAVVEQFKVFNVFQDATDIVAQANQHITAIHTESVQSIAVKENIITAQQQQRIEIDVQTSNTIQKDFINITDTEYGLDTTPMSVSEVLSPMSIDQTQPLQSCSKDADKNCKIIAESAAEEEQKPLNHRQRFFEVPDYQRDILEYFMESEKKHRPKSHYMRRQNDINYSMRTILVDWLVEVSEEYNLETETLHLAVSYIDRFLSQMSVVRGKLQLVGTAAMYIASKYEEIYPPDVGEFVFITDDTYNKAQLLRMEQIILKILAFDLCTPTTYAFLSAYSVLVSDMSEQMRYLAQYICELALLEADPYLRFLPSLISSAALALSRFLLEVPVWSPELEDITTYRLHDLKEVFLCLCKSHYTSSALSQQAIQDRYKLPKFKEVSLLKAVELDEALFDKLVADYYEHAPNSSSHTAELSMRKANNENVRRMISLMFK